LPRITSFFHQENIAEQHKSENVDLHEETSNITPTCVIDVSTSKKELVSQEEKEGSSVAVQTAGDADFLEKESQLNGPDVNSTKILTENSVADVAFLDKNNAMQMEDFLKLNISRFQKISRVMLKITAFHIISEKNLSIEGTCKRDWLCWRKTKQSLFCAPCFLFHKSSADTSVLGSHQVAM
jgi:hypothetical protein